MIQVVFVIPTLDRSGAEKQLMLLASRLPADEFRTHVVALTRGGPYEQTLRQSGVPVTVIGKRTKFDPLTLWKLRGVLRELQPDIIHSWMFAGNAYTRFLYGKTDRPAVVVSERCVDTWKSRWQLWLDRQQIHRCRMLVANSQPVVEFYQELGYPADRTTVIHNGIDVRQDSFNSRRSAREMLGIADDVPLVGFVGRLARQKRVRDMIWSLELLHHLQPRVEAVLVGDGPERDALEQFAVQIRCANRVRFLGHRDDVRQILPACDVFWLASDFEGQSNSLMEAMAAGLPVVASDIAPNRELVIPGETGHLFPVGNRAMLSRLTHELLSDRNVAQQFGQAGRQRMQSHFSVEQMVQAHARLYRELVHDPSPPARASREPAAAS